MEDSGEKTEKQVLCNPKRSCAFCAILLFLYAIIRLPGMWQNIGVEMIRRETVNARMIEFDTYAKAHPDNYYYMDVYSTVDFSEKIFEDVDNSQKNYDILGGWVSGSPLQMKATIPYQEAAFSRAELLLQDNFYYVCEWGSDTEFLEEFYSGMGIVVSLREETKIGKAENALIVYKLEIERNNVN